MPFQISELMVRVGAVSPDGALAKGPPDPVTNCKHGGTTCRPPDEPGTACRAGGTTCAPQPDPGTQCKHSGTTCKPGKSSAGAARDAELELVLGQLRAALAATRAEESRLTTV